MSDSHGPHRHEPGRFQRLEELFHAALDLPEAERASFLEARCAGDAALREEVERLLELDEGEAREGGDGLDGRLADLALKALGASGDPREGTGEHAASWDERAASWEGRTVGPYRIIDRLGQGGMGVVYLAERDDVGMRVALKVVRGSLAAPELERRFLLERRVLARLEHPGIARILDAGMGPDGTPWLAMDLVEGEPVTRYGRDHGLGLEERLRLFLQVCEAVAYAHARLVVHRDIKPSNVLVDPEGRVKLLDFGIAKLLGEDEAEVEATRTGLRAFSPEYAAPEQVTGDPITTATDVHALGGLLFEMLSGERPYRPGGDTPVAAMRALVETEPRRLSAVASADPGASLDGRALAGDLDAVCLKALAREPERRYRSAQELADDVSRFLEGYPVEARLPTLRYRTVKFMRRNAAGVAAAAVVLLALAGGLGASLWQGARARAALAESEEVATFLAELFAASDPAENRGRDIGARELLEDGIRRVDELDDQPRVQARMLEVMARAYHGLGESERARDLARRSLAQRRAVLGERHVDVAATLHTLGEILDELGERERSIDRYREALEIRREELGEEDERTTFTMIRLARMLHLVGEFDEAETVAREALAIRRAAHGPRSEATAAAMEVLGIVLWQGPNQLEQAEALFQEALAIREEVFGADDPRLDPVLVPFATLLADLGRPDEGEELARRAVEIRRRVYGDDHPSVAFRLGSLSYALTDAGRLEEAESMLRDVLARFRRHYPGDYAYTATTLGNLGSVFSSLQQHDSALAYYGEARDMWARLYGEDSPPVAVYDHNIGHALSGLDRPAEAEAAYRRAYDLRRSLFGAGSAQALRTGSLLADLVADRGRPDEAETLLREVLVEQRRLYPDGHPSLALTMERLALVLEQQGRPDEMQPLLEEALAYWEGSVGPEHEHRRRVTELMARFLAVTERTEGGASRPPA